MRIHLTLAAACVAAAFAAPCFALTSDPASVLPGTVSVAPLPASIAAPVAGEAWSSTSAPLDDARTAYLYKSADRAGEVSTKPFSAVGIALKVGAEGFGFDVATPLARKFNLRAGASFFSYSTTLTEDGVDVSGTVTFRKVATMVDYFPFGGSFRISGGVVLYNGNHLTANATVAGGKTFTLNDVDYTSSAVKPVNGTFDVAFGQKVAPSLTIGFGNLVPRKAGKHISVPFEFGFEYISDPLINLSLSGIACPVGQPATSCAEISTDPTTKANVQGEQKQLNDDISPLRFYPILSIGIGYKF